MTITLTRGEAQQVLDALEDAADHIGCPDDDDAIGIARRTLRARLAQPEPEQLGEIVPADEEQLKRIAKLVEPEPEPMAWLTKELMADYFDMVAESIENNRGEMLRHKAHWLRVKGET